MRPLVAETPLNSQGLEVLTAQFHSGWKTGNYFGRFNWIAGVFPDPGWVNDRNRAVSRGKPWMADTLH
jgi:hypothetical protein